MTYWKCLLCAVCILLPLCFAAGCAAFPKADDPPEPPQETVDTPAEPDIPVVPAPEPEPEPEPAEDALVDVCTYLPGVYADLRYATENNFTGQVIYDFTQPQLRYGTLKKLAQAQEMLAERDLALKIWDAYRLMYIWTKETIKSNRFTVAYNSQIVVVVFDKLNNASVLVGIVKLDCNIAALMHIDTLYQVYDYPPVEGLNVFVL